MHSHLHAHSPAVTDEKAVAAPIAVAPADLADNPAEAAVEAAKAQYSLAEVEEAPAYRDDP